MPRIRGIFYAQTQLTTTPKHTFFHERRHKTRMWDSPIAIKKNLWLITKKNTDLPSTEFRKCIC